MPAPSNANSLSLGAPVVDATTIDTMDDVRVNFAKVSEVLVGCGFPCGYQGTGMVVLNVYAEDDGEGGHLLWGGNPTDPLSPIPIIVSASGSATVIWQEEGSTVKTSGTVNFVGAGVTVTDEGDGKATVTIDGGGGSGSTDAFGTIAVSGQSSVVADAAPDTVTFIAGAGMTITTSAGADEVTWTNNSLAFKTISVSGQSDVVADAIDDTLTLIAGSNVTITTSAAGDSITIASAVDGVGYDEVMEEGAGLTKRAKLNFIGEHVTAVDNAGSSRTDVTVEYFILIEGTTTDPVTAADATFDVDGVIVVHGDMPELTGGELTIQNTAKIPIADETAAEFRWHEDASEWQTQPLVCHEVLGLATAAVTGGSFTIDNIELVCGSDPRSDPSDATETISVANPFGWNIDDNGTVLAGKKADGTWIAKQAECPA